MPEGRVAVTSYLVNRFWPDIGNRYAARSITLRANYRQDTATRSLRHMKT